MRVVSRCFRIFHAVVWGSFLPYFLPGCLLTSPNYLHSSLGLVFQVNHPQASSILVRRPCAFSHQQVFLEPHWVCAVWLLVSRTGPDPGCRFEIDLSDCLCLSCSGRFLLVLYDHPRKWLASLWCVGCLRTAPGFLLPHVLTLSINGFSHPDAPWILGLVHILV